jgi:regulatory protein
MARIGSLKVNFMANELYNSVLKRAMSLCAGREICLSDIKQKLKGWGVEDGDKQMIINRLINDKFIDERRYALAFVKDKFKYNKWGKIKLSAALRMKNIADETIRESLDSIDEATYRAALKSIITNRRKTLKSRSLYDLKGKLLRYGLSKGFESHLIYDLLNEDE